MDKVVNNITTLDPEVEPITEKEVKSKIMSLENHIKQMKEAHTEIVRFSNLCLYPDLKYLPHFRVPDSEKFDGNGCPWIHLHL